MNPDTVTPLLQRLTALRVGVVLALLTLVYGFGLGIAFGAAEESLKGHLRQCAETSLESAYAGDQEAADRVLSKSWAYFKRAHLHANGLGTTALALILLLAALGRPSRVKTLTAAALGLGALGYSLFWMLAGLKAPGLGSTGAAKEALAFLALPSSALCALGLLVTTVLVVRSMCGRQTDSLS